MLNYVEPYLKDHNILQLSLFYFGRENKKETKVEWSDAQGNYMLKCTCDYGVPGSLENDVYSGCMRVWVKQGMPNDGIYLSYSDICRELHLNPKDWVGRIKQALKKLGKARYEFVECFVLVTEKGKEKITTFFSLFDSASLFEYTKGKSKRNGLSKLIFPQEIKQNLEAKYYQYLDLAWYRALPEGLPRRLYEYLAKKYYRNIGGQFKISEEALCRWLPIVDKHTTNRRKRMNSIAQSLIKAEFLEKYEFDKSRKQCIFTYCEDISAKKIISFHEQEESPDVKNKNVNATKVSTAEDVTLTDIQSKYYEALKWLDSVPYFHSKRKDEIAVLDLERVASYYPGIKSEYERRKKQSKTPKAGWVYRAFIEGWKFVEQSEKENREREVKQKKEKIEQQKAMVLKFIEDNGGVDNLRYKGEIFDIMDDYGLCLINVNVLEHWDEVSLDLFKLVELV